VSNIYLALIGSFNSGCIPLDALGIFLVVYQTRTNDAHECQVERNLGDTLLQ